MFERSLFKIGFALFNQAPKVTLLERLRLQMQKNNASLPNFMTVGEVADLMRVSSMTVYRLIKAGDLGAVRVGKSYRIREDDVNTFLASRYNQTG